MKHSTKTWPIAVGVLLCGSAQAGSWSYQRGPNYVDMSGATCRVDKDFQASKAARSPNEVRSNSGNQRFYCSLNRRGTTFYETVRVNPGPDAETRATTINLTEITVRAENTSSEGVACFTFATSLATGSQSFSNTEYLCSTYGGCTNNSGWVGTNAITLPFPVNSTTKTVNFGYACDIPFNSKILDVHTMVTPNN